MAETRQTEFSPNPNRDAWASIRGYVYQARYTVLKWVQISEDVELHCESGEDLDEVSKVVSALEPNTAIDERVLNQIKHRESNLTLRDHDFLDCLANFLESSGDEQKNLATLKLRYLTNASIGKERGLDRKFPRDLAGVEALRELYRSDEIGDEEREIVETVRSMHTSTTNWHSEDTPKWRRLNALLEFFKNASPDEIYNFLAKVDIATESLPYSELARAIQDLLISRALVRPSQATEASNRLLVEVLDLLSERGPKILNREKLHRVIKSLDDGLSAEGVLANYLRLEQALSDMGLLVQQTHATVQRMGPVVEEMAGRIEEIHRSAKLRERPDPDIRPSTPSKAVRRTNACQLVTKQSTAWVHIFGSVGMGKTQLLCELTSDANCIWVSFASRNARARSFDHLKEQIVISCVRILGEDDWWGLFVSGKTSMLDILTRLQKERRTVLALDDLPELHTAPELGRLLCEIAGHFTGFQSEMYSTSQRALPASFCVDYPDILTEVHAPRLHRSGVATYLRTSLMS